MSNEHTEKSRELVIERTLSYPRSLVWEAWTKPKHLMQWFMPAATVLKESHFDVRVGKTFRTVIETDGYGIGINRGEYKEITPEHRLVFSFGWENDAGDVPYETLVTITFEAVSEHETAIRLHQSALETISSRDSHEGGWSEALDNLVQFLNTSEKA